MRRKPDSLGMILRSVITFVALACILAAFTPVLAQETDVEEVIGVEVTPSRVEQDLPDSAFAYSLLFINHEDSPRRLLLSVSGLGHDLDGIPTLLEPAEITESVALDETEFVLEPDQRREIQVEGSMLGPSAYFAVIAEFAPLEEIAGQIESRSRVASLFLLRGPEPWQETVDIVDVSILPPPEKGPLSVFAAVENTGNVHVNPSGRVRLVKNGETLDRIDLPGQNIIPRFARRLVGDWKPPRKLTGRVKLVATTVEPSARAVGYVDFTPQGDLAVPGMKIGNLVARDEGGPLVEFVLTNTGTIPLDPAISLTVTKHDEPIADTTIEQPRMEPGDSDVLQWRPEGLEEGVFLISAEVRFREQVLDRAATGLKLENRIPLWVLLLGGAILLLLLIFLFLILRRRKKAKDQEDPDESEAAEAA